MPTPDRRRLELTTPGGGTSVGLLFAVGFLSMGAQVPLLRELSVASFGAEAVYLLGVAAWLVAGAAGVMIRGRKSQAAGTGHLFLALSLLLPLSIVFLRGSRLLFHGVPGAYLPPMHQVAVAFVGMAPSGAVLGLLFRLTARDFVGRGGGIAVAYGWECAGCAAGSIVATISLGFGVPNLALGLATAVAAIGGLLCCDVPSGSDRRAFGSPEGALSDEREQDAEAKFDRVEKPPMDGRRTDPEGKPNAPTEVPDGPPPRMTRPAAIVAGAILVVALAFSSQIDLLTTSWNHPRLAALSDTPYGRVVVERNGEQAAVFENDALSHETEGTEGEEFAHLAALQARDGATMLVLGSGATGLVAELVKHSPVRIDDIEGDRRAFEVILPYLRAEDRKALSSDRVRVIFDDPRRFLATAVETSYDLIVVAAPEPSTGAANRFYTAEFFLACARRLSPGGIVALRLPSAENVWTETLARRNASVWLALSAAFPETFVIPGGTDTMIASNSPIERDPDVLVRRLAARGVATRLVTPEYLRYLLTNDRVGRVAQMLRETEAPANTDSRPSCNIRSVRLWIELFAPWAKVGKEPGPAAGIVVLALGVAMLLLARRRAGWRRVALSAAAGFCGMAVEAAVVLRFQSEAGSLFMDVGVLLAGFMAGMAAGAFLYDRLTSDVTAPPAGGRSRRRGFLLLTAMAVLSGGVGAASEWGGGVFFQLMPSTAILVVAGALSAGLFAHASTMSDAAKEGGGSLAANNSAEVIPGIYAADLLGGCAGSLLAGLFLVPLFGVAASCALVAILGLAAIAVI